MNLEIKNFLVTGSEYGYVAFFDIAIGRIAILNSASLVRPDKHPDQAWFYSPTLANREQLGFFLAPAYRHDLAERAVRMYAASTGIELVYTPPAGSKRPVAGLDARVTIKGAPGVELEDAMAGLRRTLCVGSAEALEQAGI